MAAPVRRRSHLARDPDAALISFLQTTDRAATKLAAWPRGLDWEFGEPGKPRQFEREQFGRR
jgi:hypothetical protein